MVSVGRDWFGDGMVLVGLVQSDRRCRVGLGWVGLDWRGRWGFGLARSARGALPCTRSHGVDCCTYRHFGAETTAGGVLAGGGSVSSCSLENMNTPAGRSFSLFIRSASKIAPSTPHPFHYTTSVPSNAAARTSVFARAQHQGPPSI